MGLNLKICRDVWGGWSVDGLALLPVAHLPSLSASIDYARKECAAAPATIELLIDGFYVVIHQEQGWPRRIVGPEIEPPRAAAAEANLRGPPIWSRLVAWLKSRASRSVEYPLQVAEPSGEIRVR
jgi:hypothetical protein